MSIKLSKLVEIKDIRSVWANEATDFTPWLAKNIDLLADAVGLEMEAEQTESAVGSFNADIIAKEEGSNKKIVIENQLEDTDHDHLGKIITYASGKDASYVIWVVKRAREEHRAAIEWLNSHTDEEIGFFLCEIKLYKIDDSNIAPKFIVIESPNEWARMTRGSTSGAETEGQQFRYEYWSAFNGFASDSDKFTSEFKVRKAGKDAWYSLAMGSSKYHINIWLLQQRSAIGIEFHVPNDKALFRAIARYGDEINAETGIDYEWNDMPDKKASKAYHEKKFKIKDNNDWETEFEWIIDSVLKLKKAIKKHV